MSSLSTRSWARSVSAAEGAEFDMDTPHCTRAGAQPAPAWAGFTLLEVMVALTILAVGLVTVLELLAGSMRLGGKASHRTQAALYGQNVMDRIFAQAVLEDGEQGGKFPNGYSWQVRVREIYPDDDDDRLRPEEESPTDFLHLKEIEVRIGWHEYSEPKVFILRSLRAFTEEVEVGLDTDVVGEPEL